MGLVEVKDLEPGTIFITGGGSTVQLLEVKDGIAYMNNISLSQSRGVDVYDSMLASYKIEII